MVGRAGIKFTITLSKDRWIALFYYLIQP